VIGLDQTSFAKCFDERQYLESIFQDRQEANRWGFHGTPGFLLIRTVGGPTEKEPAIAIPGAVPFEEFAEEIDRMLATAPRSQGNPPSLTGRWRWHKTVNSSFTRFSYVSNTIVLVIRNPRGSQLIMCMSRLSSFHRKAPMPDCPTCHGVST
jgi:hypothetical protein